jgi:antitoxin component YwqK of YwqJK toxin-antitoxin module
MFKFKLTKGIVMLIFLMSSSLVFGQDQINYRHSVDGSFKMDFYILSEVKKMKYDESLTYFWFRSQAIHQTQGSSAGDVLHGKFSKFYSNGQLAEQGEFYKGLKNGIWLTWYENGQLKTKLTYSKGVLDGKFSTYDQETDSLQTGKYQNGTAKLKIKKTPKSKRKKVEDPSEEKKKWVLFKKNSDEMKPEESGEKENQDTTSKSLKEWWGTLFKNEKNPKDKAENSEKKPKKVKEKKVKEPEDKNSLNVLKLEPNEG